ncbi:MAG TPA: hypothetical protein PLA46_10995 [Phycicoccus sp.]|jgi:hypothetical protein|nr:hypothetical protein [Phycicoccus sp.]
MLGIDQDIATICCNDLDTPDVPPAYLWRRVEGSEDTLRDRDYLHRLNGIRWGV